MTAGSKVFRAVIVKKYPGSEPFTVYEGPYGSAAAARARVTLWTNYLGQYTEGCDRGATAHVEIGTISWARLADQ